MTARILLSTACDASYFPFGQGAIRSVREMAQLRPLTVAFLDLGCTREQHRWLQSHADAILQPGWDFDFPGRDDLPGHVRSQLVRPFLPRYFPGFDIYVWLDADAWVQDWSALDLLIRGAERRGLAIVPEIDRGSLQQYGDLPVAWGYFHHHYELSFGREAAERFRSYPMLNTGAFAMHRSAPHWRPWAENLHAGLQRAYTPLTEQLALNLAVYGQGLFPRTEMLPAWCNWTTHYGLPAWDRAASRFVEPYLPHTPVGILHLTHTPKNTRTRVRTTDGDVVEVSLLYRGNE